MRLALTCLGGFQVTVDQQPAAFATNPARALLTYLALETGLTDTRAHHRETLADLLWPDYLAKAAHLNLSQTLARLRRAINDYQSDPPFLQIQRQSIQLTVPTVTVDVWRFQQLLATCTTHRHAEPVSCPTCCAQLVEAVNLYQGPLLAGEVWTDSRPFEEWLLLKREQLQRQALDALHTLAVHYEAAGAYDQAQHYAHRQVALEPWCEVAHRQLMRALALAGQRSAALAHYESCRHTLREELAVDPDPATVALVEAIRRDDFKLPILPEQTLDFRLPDQQAKIQNLKSKITSPDSHKILSRLEPLSDQRFFGIDAAQGALLARLCAPAAPWLLAIDGIGGIGKTALAARLVQELVERAHFADIAWVSALQTEFQPAIGHPSDTRPTLDAESLTALLLAQLLEEPPLTASTQEKRATLSRLLKAQPYLVVIDNLEAVADAHTLIPFLHQLVNPSKFLLTSRPSLQAEEGAYCYTLHELREADVLAFLRHEAEVRGIQTLIDARQTQLQRIYQVVGGNPLALKLVLGQVRFLPLAQVLANLQDAQGNPVHDLYTYIYRQAWQLLDGASRRLLLLLPGQPNSSYQQLAALGVLDAGQLQQALAQLLTLSLVQVGGDLDEPRYTLHRLTETFLLREVVQWLTPVFASPTISY